MNKLAQSVIKLDLRGGAMSAPRTTKTPYSEERWAATDLSSACRDAMKWSRPELLALAVARGCSHYASQWLDLPPVKGSLPNEVLGCAIMRGPADVETFRAIRCGAMVLSDLGNEPAMIGAAALRLGVAGRVVHVARLALKADDHPVFWRQVLAALSAVEPEEPDYLPGVSRLVSETRMAGPGQGASRQWLRLGSE